MPIQQARMFLFQPEHLLVGRLLEVVQQVLVGWVMNPNLKGQLFVFK
jgi:hypothetical protein